MFSAKKITLIFILILQTTLNYGKRRYSPFMYGYKENPIEAKINALKMREDLKKRLRKKINDISKEIEDTSDEEEKKKLEERIKKYKDILDGDWGDILLAGIAGKYAEKTIIDPVGNNKLEGITKGSILLLAGSASDSVGKSMEHYSKKLFDYSLGSIEKMVKNFITFIFHGGKKPFTIEEIISWKKLISSDLREIEVMLKNAEKNSSVSREEILREIETNEHYQEEKTINLWNEFIEDTACTCEQLAQEIENRKEYYKKNTLGFGIQNISDRIINKLLKTKNWLISVKSLKDFASLSEVKSIIPAMKKSLDNYFENLENQIKPLDSSKSSKSSLSTSSRRRNHWDDDDDDLPDYLY
ncbi:hypothetical protein GF385_04025 [Candidatus Dependentiae bacterium]|nr:hypothetical protein [Candidatus Dependentiae bacterium]